MTLSRDISNAHAGKPLGQFGAALRTTRIPDLRPITTMPVKMDPEVWPAATFDEEQF